MRWYFTVEQFGAVMAMGDAPSKAQAMREALHYTTMYGQDGPVETRVWRGRRPKAEALSQDADR